MDSSAYSFIAWIVLMVIMLAGLLLAARHSRRREKKTEDIASRALPQIGEVAERAHSRRFGAPPDTGRPSVGRGHTISWYPSTKSKPAKHA